MFVIYNEYEIKLCQYYIFAIRNCLAVCQQTGKHRTVLQCPRSTGENHRQVLVDAINQTLGQKDSFLTILQ